ncbi:hypothetical protein ON010_g5439 [Phytophthora cinnamomi]|nr:hypothetical protein ON010_g5439 [Phytophthora cinnamomi]
MMARNALQVKQDGALPRIPYDGLEWADIIAAGENYSSMFQAMKLAAELRGRLNLVHQKVIDAFFVEGLIKFNVGFDQGCTSK